LDNNNNYCAQSLLINYRMENINKWIEIEYEWRIEIIYRFISLFQGFWVIQNGKKDFAEIYKNLT